MTDAANKDGASNEKQRQLDRYRVDREQGQLTTQQGVRIDSTDNALTVAQRGPMLLRGRGLHRGIRECACPAPGLAPIDRRGTDLIFSSGRAGSPSPTP